MFYANSSNQGLTYSQPIRVGTEGVNVSRPYLMSLGQQVWLVWKEFDGQKSSVYLKESRDDGKTWATPKILASTVGYSDHPLLLSRGNEVFLSWLTHDDGYQLINIGQKQ
ncbi:sialidase family protein [Polynucleobacter necessarius]|uniref:sialidase family protein n=1 Tax=Polynucleobacter necessarius TaxID=576610 RepID=UPI000E098DB9|nr:sialidase family protein [Polynucleobacter necessarius]